MYDWSPYATGGALRPDSFSGMNPAFQGTLMRLFEMAPPDIRRQLQVYSGYRSPERQAQLWDAALKKYGSPEAARKWVAPPGRSQHGHGNAADLKFMTPEARDWVRANAEAAGLTFPLSNEPWHVELAGARSGTTPSTYRPRGMEALVARAPEPQQPQLKPTDMPPGLLSGIGSPNTPQPAASTMMAGADPWSGMRSASAAAPTASSLASTLQAVQGLLSSSEPQQPQYLPPPPEPHRPQFNGLPPMLSLLSPSTFYR